MTDKELIAEVLALLTDIKQSDFIPLHTHLYRRIVDLDCRLVQISMRPDTLMGYPIVWKDVSQLQCLPQPEKYAGQSPTWLRTDRVYLSDGEQTVLHTRRGTITIRTITPLPSDTSLVAADIEMGSQVRNK